MIVIGIVAVYVVVAVVVVVVVPVDVVIVARFVLADEAVVDNVGQHVAHSDSSVAGFGGIGNEMK